ncbi:MAG: hypothetical protein M3Y87_30785, partial [Myxococcota bacterium]|nr:hypothetical protein [Myxococcota bacterium]
SRGRALAASTVALPGCPEARIDFARDAVAIACPRVERLEADPGVALGDASIVILCAADIDFGTALPDAARALKAAGAKAIAVAGKPGAHEQALRAAGVDAFVHVGADVVAALETLLDRAEAR